MANPRSVCRAAILDSWRILRQFQPRDVLPQRVPLWSPPPATSLWRRPRASWPQPPHLAPFNAEEQWFCFQCLPAPHPVSEGEYPPPPQTKVISATVTTHRYCPDAQPPVHRNTHHGFTCTQKKTPRQDVQIRQKHFLNAKQKIIPAAPPCQLWLFHHHYVLKYT